MVFGVTRHNQLLLILFQVWFIYDRYGYDFSASQIPAVGWNGFEFFATGEVLVRYDFKSTTSGKAGGLYCEPLKAVIKAWTT